MSTENTNAVEPDVVEVASVNVNIDPERRTRLEKTARNHIITASGIGLVPFPVVDVVGVLLVQLDLVRDIAREYDIPFRHDLGKAIVISLVGSVGSVVTGGVIGSLIKVIPVIGYTTGAVSLPVFAGATTYAIYKVFVQHFESGGTFLDLDPAKVKSYFAEEFAKGKKVVADIKSEDPAASPM